MIKKKFYDPIFETQLYFVLGKKKDEVEITKWVGIKEGVLNLSQYGEFRQLSDVSSGAFSYLVFITENDRALLVHELLHFVNRCLYDRGIDIILHGKDNHDETHAYYLEYWFKTISKFIDKELCKKKKPVSTQGAKKQK